MYYSFDIGFVFSGSCALAGNKFQFNLHNNIKMPKHQINWSNDIGKTKVILQKSI